MIIPDWAWQITAGVAGPLLAGVGWLLNRFAKANDKEHEDIRMSIQAIQRNVEEDICAGDQKAQARLESGDVIFREIKDSLAALKQGQEDLRREIDARHQQDLKMQFILTKAVLTICRQQTGGNCEDVEDLYRKLKEEVYGI